MSDKSKNNTFTVTDMDGQEKHKWSTEQLQALLSQIKLFVEDCTIEERKRFDDSLIDIESLLVQRIRHINNYT